jgi:hypothetical protein
MATRGVEVSSTVAKQPNLCVNLSPSIFEVKDKEGVERAKGFCRNCSSQAECAEDAIKIGIKTGKFSMVQGGLSQEELRTAAEERINR